MARRTLTRNPRHSVGIHKYLSKIQELLASDQWDEFKVHEGDFTRDGALSPELLVTLLVAMVADGGRRGYTHLLDAFWDEAESQRVPLPTEEPVSAAAFCKARHRLQPELVRRLVHDVSDACDDVHADGTRWKGHQVFAVDGCKMSVRRSDELWEKCGAPEGAYYPQVMVSTLFDVLHKVPYDVSVVACASCERTELVRLLERLSPGDVLLLDRGYPSYEILRTLHSLKIDFVVRVPTSHTFAAVEEFVATGGRDRLLWMRLPPDPETGEVDTIPVRAVRRLLDDGSEVVFLTSLPSQEARAAEVADLYHLRWNVEEYYKLSKGAYVGQAQLHSKTFDGVCQEIYAFALFVALARLLLMTAAEAHQVPVARLSQKAALLATADSVVCLLLAVDEARASAAIHALLRRLVRHRDPLRPGRSFPRRSFQPQPRWGPSGRRN